MNLSSCADSRKDAKKILNGRKRTEKNRNDQKHTETNRNGKKRTEMDRKGQKRTATDKIEQKWIETDRNGQKHTDTDIIGQKRSEADGNRQKLTGGPQKTFPPEKCNANFSSVSLTFCNSCTLFLFWTLVRELGKRKKKKNVLNVYCVNYSKSQI